MTVLVRSGQTEDSLPPASYQHTPNDGACVSVFKSCKRGSGKGGGGRLRRVAADVKIHVVSHLVTSTASFSSLTSAVSLLFIVVCVVFLKVVYLCLNLAVL